MVAGIGGWSCAIGQEFPIKEVLHQIEHLALGKLACCKTSAHRLIGYASDTLVKIVHGISQMRFAGILGAGREFVNQAAKVRYEPRPTKLPQDGECPVSGQRTKMRRNKQGSAYNLWHKNFQRFWRQQCLCQKRRFLPQSF